MGGINSLGGLNNVNVDFRPTIQTNVQKPQKTDQLLPGADAVPEDAPLERANAKSIVRELDVLLLNAAGKSVSADAAKNVRTVNKSLIDNGVLTKKEADKLNDLADDAAEKLRALDKFSGRELASALMQDKKTGETVWSKGFFGMNSAAKAVKAAIEAQQTLSTELGKYNDRLACADENVVDPELQEKYTELQFQCDRRASEIDSIVFRMYCLAQEDVVKGTSTDPRTKALLDATFQELMPREAIMMHGTAEAFKKLNENLAEQMRPLAEKLDAFAADGSKVLSRDEMVSLLRDMETMKNAIANVRANGIEVTHGQGDKQYITHTEVDKSLLDGMEKILEDAEQKISHAKTTSMNRAREAFLKELETSLSPLDVPGGIAPLEHGATHPAVVELTVRKNELIKLLNQFAFGKVPMSKFDAAFDKCVAKYNNPLFFNLERSLPDLGVDPMVARSISRTVTSGLGIIKAQFKEMMESTAKLRNNNPEFWIASSDVRRIMLGEKGLSNVVEAKALGFKPEDVDPAAEEQNIVASRALGSGAGGKTYLLTTKSGEELVFKPELDSRIGLNILALGSGSYIDKQKTANLNLATQDTAKAFGCEDVVVKYSVGSHDGQFGIFMEKAKGYPANAFRERKLQGDNGIAPADMHKIGNASVQTKIQGAIAQKLNNLMWLDLITGQGDRHWENYFVHVDKDTKEVTIKGIDNDASFSSWRIGLQKYSLDKGKAALFEEQLKNVCSKVLGWGWKTEYERRVSTDPGLVKNDDGSMTVDLAKVSSPEIKMAIIRVIGMQSIALPEEIDQKFYDKLMEMERDPAKKQAYLDSIASRISPDSLRATEMRLDEAIAHAKKLKAENKVYAGEQWQDADTLSGMTKMQTKVEIVKSDGSMVEADTKLDCVRDFCERNCPSFYKRDGFQWMFNLPKA